MRVLAVDAFERCHSGSLLTREAFASISGISSQAALARYRLEQASASAPVVEMAAVSLGKRATLIDTDDEDDKAYSARRGC
jgi:hypothetical protein